MAIISLMENERDADRVSPQKEKPLGDLMGQLDADDLVSDIADLANEGATAADVVPILKDYNVRLKVIRKTIESNLIYYSRLATVGTIAQMLVHEIRNRTIAFGSFLDFIKDRFGPFKDKNLKEEYMYAEEAANSLETLADTFSPLASRGFRRRHKDSLLEDRIQSCLNFQRGELKNKHIKCVIPKGSTPVAVDPGELDAILLNLLTNSIYWLGQKKDKKRQINFQFSKIDKGSRVRIWIHDNGPGLTNEDGEKVFWPGFTKKPGGIGMGLTIASELVNEYGGKMAIATPGKLGGASFVFDLPIRK